MPSLDTSNVTNVSCLWYFHSYPREPLFIIFYFNVSSVVNMEGAFSSADVFDADLSQWIVTSVTNMSYMFPV